MSILNIELAHSLVVQVPSLLTWSLIVMKYCFHFCCFFSLPEYEQVFLHEGRINGKW